MKSEIPGVGKIAPATEGDPCQVCAAIAGGDEVRVPSDAAAAERAVGDAIAFGAAYLECSRIMNRGETVGFFQTFCDRHRGVLEQLVNRMASLAGWDRATTSRVIREHFGFHAEHTENDVH